MDIDRVPAEELPKIAEWMSGWTLPKTEGDLLSQIVTVESAVVLMRLFWPPFIQVKNCTLLSSHYVPENFDAWWTSLKGDSQSIEQVINHVHLWDEFAPTLPDGFSATPYAAALEELGRILQQTWTAALKVEFPDSTFVVDYSATESDYGPTVTFWSSGSPPVGGSTDNLP